MTTHGDDDGTTPNWPGAGAAEQASTAERTTMLGGEQATSQHTPSQQSQPQRGASQQAQSQQAQSQQAQSQQAASGGTTSGEQPVQRWHRGLDLGLFVLRVVLGATMLGHGLQKLFGLFGGPGINGFADMLGSEFGFADHTTLLTWITALTESIGGLLLVVGLFSPLAAAAVLGVTASVVYVKFHGGFFGPPGGFEYEFLLATGAFTLLFTGPGRLSVDVHTPWQRKPVPFGVSGLVLAAAACVVILILFR